MASSLSAYLGEIGRHQLLTPEQELMLGRKVQAMVVLQERCTRSGGVGDACTYGYGGSACSSNRGTCTISTSFTDNPDTTDLNESLICVTR